MLDPYMGGGTTIVEALAHGRRAVGCDINELAVFVARAKVTPLTHNEVEHVRLWALTAAQFGYHDDLDVSDLICEHRTRNLTAARARPIKKLIALALGTCDELASANVRIVARCALLSASQWALNGRRIPVSVDEFRQKLIERAFEMADQSGGLARIRRGRPAPVLLKGSAEILHTHAPFADGRLKADLVVTSPPYPGVHVLYHRWQVDGRKETPAPYWIAGCLDGKGDAFYNFGSRKQASLDDYFARSLATLESIRKVVKDDAFVVQLVAFAEPRKHLPRYLQNMDRAGFVEVNLGDRRTWRNVPGRSWHADLKGDTSSAREVLLVHRAA